MPQCITPCKIITEHPKRCTAVVVVSLPVITGVVLGIIGTLALCGVISSGMGSTYLIIGANLIGVDVILTIIFGVSRACHKRRAEERSAKDLAVNDTLLTQAQEKTRQGKFIEIHCPNRGFLEGYKLAMNRALKEARDIAPVVNKYGDGSHQFAVLHVSYLDPSQPKVVVLQDLAESQARIFAKGLMTQPAVLGKGKPNNQAIIDRLHSETCRLIMYKVAPEDKDDDGKRYHVAYRTTNGEDSQYFMSNSSIARNQGLVLEIYAAKRANADTEASNQAKWVKITADDDASSGADDDKHNF